MLVVLLIYYLRGSLVSLPPPFLYQRWLADRAFIILLLPSPLLNKVGVEMTYYYYLLSFFLSFFQSFHFKFLQVTTNNQKQQRINKNYITTNYTNNLTRKKKIKNKNKNTIINHHLPY